MIVDSWVTVEMADIESINRRRNQVETVMRLRALADISLCLETEELMALAAAIRSTHPEQDNS